MNIITVYGHGVLASLLVLQKPIKARRMYWRGLARAFWDQWASSLTCHTCFFMSEIILKSIFVWYYSSLTLCVWFHRDDFLWLDAWWMTPSVGFVTLYLYLSFPSYLTKKEHRKNLCLQNQNMNIGTANSEAFWQKDTILSVYYFSFTYFNFFCPTDKQ